MSNYLETMDGMNTNTNHTQPTTVSECIFAEIASFPKNGSREPSLNNDVSSEINEEEEESSDRNSNNCEFEICASKAPSTEFNATYLVLSKEKTKWISRNAELYQNELLQPMMNRSKYNRNVVRDNDFDLMFVMKSLSQRDFVHS
jgi:hypothetical protein